MGVLVAFLSFFFDIDPTIARTYLAERNAACGQAASFWHHDLCGPMMFVDPVTRQYVTADATGTLPASMGVANTAVDWNGVKWTMLLWPVPADPSQRLSLMLHESFHRVQEQVGFPMANPSNAHLDTLDGRYWFQLELRALTAALRSEGAVQNRHAADAVWFRRKRRSLFPRDRRNRACSGNE